MNLLPVARAVPLDHKPFADLPVRYVTAVDPARRLAVHVRGTLRTDRVPLVLVPGLHRNMSDFAAAAALLGGMIGDDWPIVLVDLPGRGRSADRERREAYSTLADARDLLAVTDALGAERAVLVGEGHGGQVLMALAAQRPGLVAGAVLLDSGPVLEAPGLVRLRTNLEVIGTLRGEAAFQRTTRRVLAVDYPAASEAALDALALRTYFLDESGRVHPLFDPRIGELLEGLEADDALVPQWAMFDTLAHAPLVLMRSSLTGLLARETLDQMLGRRPDAKGFLIEGQGSPALLDVADDVRPIADLVTAVTRPRAGRRR